MQGPWSLSAVIPTYDRAPVLERAIDSVLAQNRRPNEIIVVDDGSSDNTHEVVARYGRSIRFIRKENGGVSTARNAGVRESRSDFIAFLDSDDFWYPDHLARIEDAIVSTQGSAGLYFSDLELAPSRGGGSAWHLSGFSIDGSHELRQDARPWVSLDIQPMTIQASAARRDAYIAAGGCNPSLRCREDTHLFFKLGLSTPMCAVAGCAGVLAGDGAGSLTTTFSSAHETYWRCTAWLYDDVLDEAGDRLTVEQRRALARRLADAHWMLAMSSGAGSPGKTLHHLQHAIRHDPSLVPRRVARRLARVPRSR
jgi:glycosyltransferase involved in cell wall biosynthesis